MISPFEPRRQVSDLLTERAKPTVADLLGRAGVSQGIAELLFPEWHDRIEETPQEGVSREQQAEREERKPVVSGEVEAARVEGYRRARTEYEGELSARLAEERRRIDRMRAEFARDRQRFFSAAESQVVRLALAVASRVLSREVAADGMHLRATVKAALARVQDNSATTLLVPAEEAEAWTALLGQSSAGKVRVVAEERMSPGECVLETSVGRVELGVDVQIEEIERGFGELLQGQGAERMEKRGPERAEPEPTEQESTGTRGS